MIQVNIQIINFILESEALKIEISRLKSENIDLHSKVALFFKTLISIGKAVRDNN